MRLRADGVGFEIVVYETLTGQRPLWVVTEGKLAGMPVEQIGNPHWLAWAYWKLKGADQRAVSADLVKCLKARWLAIYHSKGRDVDEGYLDRLDPRVPFDWQESPPERGQRQDQAQDQAQGEIDGASRWWV